MRICLINKSTKYTSTVLGLSAIAIALNWQAGHATKLLDLGIKPSFTTAEPTRDDLYLNFYDNSDQEGALGDHFEEGGRPVMEVFIDPILQSGGGMTNQANSLSVCASHEWLEARLNPRINRWVDMPNGDDVAFEIGDPTENDAYAAPNGVMLSNFVTPAWFDPEASHPDRFDYMGKVTAPFQNRGYIVTRTERGNVSNVFAKAEKKGHAGRELCECRETGKRIVVVGPSVEKMSEHKLNKLVAKFMREGEKEPVIPEHSHRVAPPAAETLPHLPSDDEERAEAAIALPPPKDDGTTYYNR